MKTKQVSTCPVCGREYQLTQTGRLRKHWKRNKEGKGLPFPPPCDGSNSKPGKPLWT
jgi:hypothetical protein